MKRFDTFIENAFVLLLFVVGINLFVYLKTSGLESLEALSFKMNTIYSLNEIYMEATLIALLLGIQLIGIQNKLIPWIEQKIERKYARIGWLLMIFILTVLNAIAVRFSFTSWWKNVDVHYAWRSSLHFATTDIFISFLFYFFLMACLVSFLRQLRYNFGEAVFYNFLLGKYYKPKEEERSFLFVDLNNSTYIAEFLGHTKYSRFINQCFNDILEACKPYHYDVYQYVGDEIVLTWPSSEDKNGKGISLFNAIKYRFLLLRFEYEEKFGISPSFKASAHSGVVASAIVGKRNRMLAYHGDVLNTTARLLELCKRYNKDILFTKAYLNSLVQPLSFQAEYITSLKLRGKNQQSEIYCANAVPQKQKIKS